MSYKLTHPDSEQEIEVEAERVSLYLAQGWRTKKGVKAPEANQAPAVTVLDQEPTPKD